MRAGPNSVLKVVPLVNNEGLVYTKPAIKMEITICGYHLSVKEVMDLDYHQHSFVCVLDKDRLIPLLKLYLMLPRGRSGLD